MRRPEAPSAKAWPRQGRRDEGCAPRSAPHSPAALGSGSVTKVLVPPHVSAGSPHAGTECRSPAGERTLVKKLNISPSGGRCKGSPRPTWAPDHVWSPSPQPRENCSSSGPPCSHTQPACGIRGQIRQRFVLATQMSWIGKWGWGKEIDPAVPEGGVSLELGAMEEVEGYGGHPCDPAQGALGRRLVHVCLVFAWYPSSSPLPQALSWGCSRLSPYPAVSMWVPEFWVPQGWSAGDRTSIRLLDDNSSRRAEIWAVLCRSWLCSALAGYH